MQYVEQLRQRERARKHLERLSVSLVRQVVEHNKASGLIHRLASSDSDTVRHRV